MDTSRSPGTSSSDHICGYLWHRDGSSLGRLLPRKRLWYTLTISNENLVYHRNRESSEKNVIIIPVKYLNSNIRDLYIQFLIIIISNVYKYMKIRSKKYFFNIYLIVYNVYIYTIRPILQCSI